VGVEIETTRGSLPHCGQRLQVRAGVVVSNADLLFTFENLIGPQHLEPGRIEELRRMRLTFPCWLTHIGLQDVPDQVLEEAQGYYWDGWDMDRVGRDALRFKLFVPTLYEPEMAPPGRQILIVQKVMEVDYDAIADWTEHKRQVESFVLTNLERVIPGITGRIVVSSSASARTSWRFTLNQRGAMLGWEMSPEQLGEGRPELVSPLKNLFLVGHWTRPGGGITPVIVSAQQVARTILDGRNAPAGESAAARGETSWRGMSTVML